MSHDQAPPLGVTHVVPILAAVFVPTAVARAAPAEPVYEADLRGDMRVAPARAELTPPSRPQAGPSPHVIYLNYGGGTISSGGNFESNSQTNTSWVCQSEFSAFGAGQLQDASVQATRVDWEAYGVTIVTSRPASGDYTMNMIGSASCGPDNSGVAPVDCNNQNPNDIVFTFSNSQSAFTADGVATTNSQEIAHSFGLMHVNQPLDIMNPSGNGSDVSFLDECFSVNGNVNCGEQHAAQCGQQTLQNSHQELLALFGPANPDTSAPTVSITSPSNGQQFTAPAAFDVTAEAADDQAVEQLRILIDGEVQDLSDTEAPWSWPVGGIPVGMYTFEVTATDVAGNEATSNAVTIEVVAAGADGGSGDGGNPGGSDGGDGGNGGNGGSADEGNAGSGGGEAGVGSGGSDGGALPPGFGLSDDGGSCACRQRDAPAAPVALVSLLLLGLAPRRRWTKKTLER